MNELGMNEMDPQGGTNDTNKKRNKTKTEQRSGRVRGVTTGQRVQESKGSQLQTSFLQLLHLNSSSDAPQKQTQSWRGTMLAADLAEFQKCGGAAPKQPCVSPVRHVPCDLTP